MDKFNDIKESAICAERLSQKEFDKQIHSITNNIHLKDYVICKHSEGNLCKYGVSFGECVICKSTYVVEKSHGLFSFEDEKNYSY